MYEPDVHRPMHQALLMYLARRSALSGFFSVLIEDVYIFHSVSIAWYPRGMQQEVTVIIVGATGHLARTKLFPALAKLAKDGATIARVIGTTRREGVELHKLFLDEDTERILASCTELFVSRFDAAMAWQRLFAQVPEARRIIHLAVPPTETLELLTTLAESQVLSAEDVVLLEKPLGTDPNHARELAAFIRAHFPPERVHCVDHYLEKEAVRNFALLRTSLPTATAIQTLGIIGSDSSLIEGRGSFYDGVGALRDIAQNHLLEVAATVLMNDRVNLSQGRQQALAALSVRRATRGQYAGYAQEIGKESVTETFAGLELASSDPVWEHARIYLATGKALKDKRTEVHIISKDRTELHLPLGAYGYEQVYLDAIAGDTRFFPSLDEILEAWRIVEEPLAAWKADPALPLYEPGTSIEDLLK
jgi:glucose-6-phosphate 1-dehydrogenase